MPEYRTAPQGAACYHCGLPVPAGAAFHVEIDGAPRAMCCAGCEAVARAIIEAGLGSYYTHRDAMPESPREALPASLDELGLFDHPDIQRGFVRPVGEDEREADLILEGITCAACVWLNEQHLARHAGVTAVQVNYATRRARVRWRESQTRLSDLLAAIAAIGYRAHPYDPRKNEEVAQRERRGALWRVLVAGFGMMQVMMYAYPAYVAGEGDMTPDIEALMRWASLVLTLPVILYSAAPFFRNAWRDLTLRRLGMDVPVALGLGVAFVASVWATLVGHGEVWFDSVTMFVFFLLCGRYLEMLARQRATRGAEALARVVPAFADRLRGDAPGETERVPVVNLVAGDRLVVRPGETVPVDGEVLDGESELDEAWLTGESRPAVRGRGAHVMAGSINRVSPLVVRADAVGEGTRLASIRRLMERAAAERPRIVEHADRVAAGFVGVLLVLAVLTAAYWGWADPERAVWIFASVLVVSCPCALSLATPVALTVATEGFGRIGLLVTRGHAIETLARTERIAFDKTGTLTEGRLRVVSVKPFADLSAAELLGLAAAIEQGSEHAVARAICEAAPAQRPVAERVIAVTGRGVAGAVGGEDYRLGTEAYVQELVGMPLPACAAGTQTTVWLGRAGEWLASIALDDTLRPDAAATLAAIQRMGIATTVLSGDGVQAVEAVALRLGIADARGALLPEDKHAAVRAFQAGGEIVAMVGDGVNDAPVLAQAQLSVAIGGGTDLARQQADVILLGEHLHPLVSGLRLARRALAVVRQNLAWSFAYNILAIPAAMTGHVTPWMAGIGMSVSSLLVVANALRLRRLGPA